MFCEWTHIHLHVSVIMLFLSSILWYRETGHEESAEKIQHKELLEKVSQNIQQICMRINQVMLKKINLSTRPENNIVL